MATLTSSIVKTASLAVGNPIHIYEGDVDLVEVAANGTAMAEQDIAVAGLGASDIVLAVTVKETAFKLAIANYYVKAAGVLAVVLANPDDAAVDPAATVTFRVVAAAIG